MEEVDPFWLDDITILYNLDKINEIIPVGSQSKAEKLNALLRFTIIISVLFSIMKMNLNYLIVIIIAAVLSVFVYKFNDLEESSYDLNVLFKRKEKMENCQRPTKDNPYMNARLTDLNKDTRKPACKLTKEIMAEQKRLFYEDLPRDIYDIYEKGNSERQFYTVPVTNVFGVSAGDTVSFAKSLFLTGKTCKEDTRQCTGTRSLFYRDLRRNRNSVTQEELLPN